MKPSTIEPHHHHCDEFNSIQMPIIRHQANARERHRTHSVNSAFLTLRQLIPTEPKTRKLSKIETLRLAKSYIEHLFAMLITGQSNKPCVTATQMNYQTPLISVPRTRNICTFCVATKTPPNEIYTRSEKQTF